MKTPQKSQTWSQLYYKPACTGVYCTTMEHRKLSPQQEKNVFYSSVNIFGTEGNNGDTIFSYWRRDHHFTLTSKPHAGLAICRAEAVNATSFLSYFKTLSIGPGPGI